jgi:hypothetical protein
LLQTKIPSLQCKHWIGISNFYMTHYQNALVTGPLDMLCRRAIIAKLTAACIHTTNPGWLLMLVDSMNFS